MTAAERRHLRLAYSQPADAWTVSRRTAKGRKATAWMTVEEAAVALGVSRKTVKAYVRELRLDGDDRGVSSRSVRAYLLAGRARFGSLDRLEGILAGRLGGLAEAA